LCNVFSLLTNNLALQKAFYWKFTKHGAPTLLDLSAAFDTIDYSVLLDGLSDWYGISAIARTWILPFVISRFQSIKIGNCFSKEVPLFCGIPYKIGHQVYADDHILIYSRHKYSCLTDKDNCLIDSSSWMTNNRLKFIANKTANLLDSSLLQCLFMPWDHYSLYVILVLHLIAILISETYFSAMSLLSLPYSWPSPYTSLYFPCSRQNHYYSNRY